jgi:shikimate kinase
VVKFTSENAPQNKTGFLASSCWLLAKQLAGWELAAIFLKKRSGQPVGARKRTGVRRKRLPASGSTSGNAVFLVGFMGAGKTSVGRALAEHLNWVFEDLDDRIQQREGRTVAEIFRDSGEPVFRRAEHAALEQVLEELRGGVARIVALGGGTFVQAENAAPLLASGVPTVFLDAPVGQLWQRCSQQTSESGLERPLLKSLEEFRDLHANRRRSYMKAAVKIGTGSRTVSEIAAEIAEKLGLNKIAIRTEQGDAE